MVGWKMKFPFQGDIPSATRMPEALKMKTLAITDVAAALPNRQRIEICLCLVRYHTALIREPLTFWLEA